MNLTLKDAPPGGRFFGDGLQLYGHANYASETVTGGFFYRNPPTRGPGYTALRIERRILLREGGVQLVVSAVGGAGGRACLLADERSAMHYGNCEGGRKTFTRIKS